MGVTEIVAADGRRWVVRRRLRWPRWRQVGQDADDLVALGWVSGDSDAAGIVLSMLIAVVVALVIILVLPLVLFSAEVLLVLGAIALFRGTWILEATTADQPETRRAWRVRGLRRSKRAMQEVIGELRAGVDAAPREGQAV